MRALILFLVSWYDKSYLAAPVIVIYLLFSLVKKRSNIDILSVVSAIPLLFSLVFFVWVPDVEFGNRWWPELDRMYWSWICLGLAVLGLNSVPNSITWFTKKDVSIVIFVHAAIIMAQTFFYYIFDVEIDFYRLLGGAIDPRVHSDLIFSFRPAGLFLEPSNFAVTVIYLLVLSLKLNVSKAVVIFGLFSVLLSGSSMGIVQTLFIFLLIANKRYSFMIGLFVPFLVVILDSHIERLENILVSGGGSFVYKVEAFEIWRSFDVWRKILGSGPGFNDCDCLIADNGLLFSTIFYFGIPISLYIFYLALKRSNWLVLFPLLLGKLTLFHPLVLIVLYLKKKEL